MDRADQLKRSYKLKPHPEGGWFAEMYTAPFSDGGRATAGSIVFLLEGEERSHFHQIDCDELWFFHEGCGLKLTLLEGEEKRTLFLGNDVERGQRAMVLIPAGAIFAAENIDRRGYTFLSCATTPAFCYEGFRLVGRQELARRFPEWAEQLAQLAMGE